MRFHLDEHVPKGVADGLRQRGIDVTTTIEVGLRGATDEEQLAYGNGDDRALVTRDADFLRLHRKGMRHAGIVYFQGTHSIGELVRSLILLHRQLTLAEMKNHVEFI